MLGLRFTTNGKIAIVVLVVLLVLLAIWIHSFFNQHTYYTCAQLRAAGHAYIHKGDAYYNPALDRDHDGISCE